MALEWLSKDNTYKNMKIRDTLIEHSKCLMDRIVVPMHANLIIHHKKIIK